jgi:hypothetical protein
MKVLLWIVLAQTTMILLILLLVAATKPEPDMGEYSCQVNPVLMTPHITGRLSQCGYKDCGEEPAFKRIPCKLT